MAALPQPPQRILDINPAGNAFDGSNETAVLGSTLFFTATNGSSGRELWKTDGTAAGTVVVKDIWPGSEGSNPMNLRVVGSTLFFAADDGTHGRELWKSDGTAAGTVLVKDVRSGNSGFFGRNYGSDPGSFTAVGSTLFFTANDGVNGWELWKSNGTAAGTVLVKDIGPGGSGSFARSLTAVAGKLYFAADDGVNGFELWKSDGTTAGTVLVKQINPGGGHAYPLGLTAAGGTLYFSANDDTNGRRLWRSNGTAAGTALVKNVELGNALSYMTEAAAVGQTLFFTAAEEGRGEELWKTDGTAAGTVLVKDIAAGVSSSFPQKLLAVGGTVYFTANDGMHGQELWKSDGTAAGTVRIKDIRPGSDMSNPGAMTAVGGTVYFNANDGTHGYELWRSNGTAEGTVMMGDIQPGIEGSFPRLLKAVGNTLYFTADDGQKGLELWKLQSVVAPAAPPAVQAAPGAGRVTLSWTPPADNGGATITDYFVQMSADGGRTWTRYLDGTRPDPVANVTGLTGGTSYRFRVAAVNSVGVGAYSEASAAVIPLSAVPDRPTDVKGKPGTSAGSVTLTWKAPLANGRAITDYFIQVSADNGLTWKRFLDGSSTDPAARVTGLTTGKSYLFRVAAVNSVGLGSYSLRSGPITAG